jgi:shikimate dehydrogenase
MPSKKFRNDSAMYISIADRPSEFGYRLFNDAFQALGINSFYKPTRVQESDLKAAVIGLRGLNVRGCGISMPHKVRAIKYVDEVESNARSIGAINTILNNNGNLIGYNTDFFSAKKIFEELRLEKSNALILGCGGVAKAVVTAMKVLGIKVTICGRNRKNVNLFSKKYGVTFIPWEVRESFQAKILVNCTPIGMEPFPNQMPISKAALIQYEIVADLVASPGVTMLIKEANKLNLKCIPGYIFVLHQAVKQFELYTGRCDAELIMRTTLSKMLKVEF